MTVARTCARRRKQIRIDGRYGRRATISKKLQGRSKLLAQQSRLDKSTA